MTPEDLLARLLYRDALMLVINKPSGIAVHAASGKNQNIERYFDALMFGLPRKPSLAHRLDKDTSGCLVLGRHTRALATLSRLFAEGKVKKIYWAVVVGSPPAEEGLIDMPLGQQSERKHHWRTKPDPEGKPAQTVYKVLASHGEYSLLELSPLTGRTHQLRVHCATSGFPIVGDKIYGDEAAQHLSPYLLLHARSIEVPLYPKKPSIFVEAPAPDYFFTLTPGLKPL